MRLDIVSGSLERLRSQREQIDEDEPVETRETAVSGVLGTSPAHRGADDDTETDPCALDYSSRRAVGEEVEATQRSSRHEEEGAGPPRRRKWFVCVCRTNSFTAIVAEGSNIFFSRGGEIVVVAGGCKFVWLHPVEFV